MKIEKKVAYKNIKCNNCGDVIYKPREENPVYFCWPEYITSFRVWKLCKKCVNEIFSEEVRKKVK